MDKKFPNFKVLGFKPGDKIVKVYHSGKKIDYYSVVFPNAYINKCEKDGKRAEYLGVLKSDYTF